VYNNATSFIGVPLLKRIHLSVAVESLVETPTNHAGRHSWRICILFDSISNNHLGVPASPCAAPASVSPAMDPISALKSKGIEDDRIVEYQAAFQMFDVYNRGFFDENDLKELLSRFSTRVYESNRWYLADG
jgi:hypothetical protein